MKNPWLKRVWQAQLVTGDPMDPELLCFMERNGITRELAAGEALGRPPPFEEYLYSCDWEMPLRTMIRSYWSIDDELALVSRIDRKPLIDGLARMVLEESIAYLKSGNDLDDQDPSNDEVVEACGEILGQNHDFDGEIMDRCAEIVEKEVW